MGSTLNLILVLSVLWVFWYSSTPVESTLSLDDALVLKYHMKENFKQKVVLIIEKFDNLQELLTLIRNILKQTIRVNSIILITDDEKLKKVKLLHNTCIFNKLGGLSLLFKESSAFTKLVFISPTSFKAFSNPNFLKFFLTHQIKLDGLIQVNNNEILSDINMAYSNHTLNNLV